MNIFKKKSNGKTIIVTGATDGIGFETVKILAQEGYNLGIHGRNETKLANVKNELNKINKNVEIKTFKADLSLIDESYQLVEQIKESYKHIDGLLNNAGVFKTPAQLTVDNLDIRFAVNTIAPYIITTGLFELFDQDGRIVNVSSAAQESVVIEELIDGSKAKDNDDGMMYAQSKLGILMWTNHLVATNIEIPVMISVNPASLLASKMVKDAYGIPGKDITIGAKIFADLLTNEKYKDDSGKYFDNDYGVFAAPHPDGENQKLCQEIVEVIEKIIN